MGKLTITHMGQAGVNVDKNPLELDDNELLRAQNAVAQSNGGQSSLQKRPGLIALNTDAVADIVLGGIDIPFSNLVSGSKFFLIGRGPIS